MILKISLRAKAGVPKTLVKRKLRLHSLYFPQNTLMLTESRGEFSDLHSIFRLRALRYCSLHLIPRTPCGSSRDKEATFSVKCNTDISSQLSSDHLSKCGDVTEPSLP